MATWKAFLGENVHKSDDGTSVQVLVHYFDADDQLNAGVGPGPPPVFPQVILHTQLFTFPVNRTQGQMAQAIRDRGAEVRTTYNAAATLATANPVGTVINIP